MILCFGACCCLVVILLQGQHGQRCPCVWPGSECPRTSVWFEGLWPSIPLPGWDQCHSHHVAFSVLPPVA